MSDFAYSLRALAEDRGTRFAPLLIVAGTLGMAWAAWFALAPVTIYELSTAARVELDTVAHPVAAKISGRVASLSLELGRHVDEGELLLELDTEAELRRLDEVERALRGLRPQLEAARRELLAEERAQRDGHKGAVAAVESARARRTEADASARTAAEELRRFTLAQKYMPEMDLIRARGEAERRRAAADATAVDVDRIASDQRTRNNERMVRMERLRREVAQLEAQIDRTLASTRVLEQEIENRRIRAPATGVLGDVKPLQTGAVVSEGERLATVVPPGQLRMVAELPAAALGRLRSGQDARVRLDGFPWLEYGRVEARVTRVATETHAGAARVELAFRSGSSARIPLQHGQPGTVEIAVERVTPVTLALRAVGRRLFESQDDRNQSSLAAAWK